MKNNHSTPFPPFVGFGGCTVWVTGMSGAGKTTVSQRLTSRLRENGVACILLDGDVLRGVFGDVHGHGTESRRLLAMSYARLCRELSAQGFLVICATMSMFHDVRRWNRENIPNYHEIYLRVPIDELRRRDPKGLYAAAQAKRITNIVGLDIPPEEPEAPDLLIDNYGDRTTDEVVEKIIARFGFA